MTNAIQLPRHDPVTVATMAPAGAGVATAATPKTATDAHCPAPSGPPPTLGV